MLRKIMFYAAFSALLVTTLSTPALARKMSRTEDFTVPASGIKAVNFKNIFLTDLTYNGEGDTDTFSVKFVRVVNTDDTDEFEDVLAEFDLDITTSDGKVTVELIHPELVSSGILKRIFKRKEWRVEITVTGPSYVDLTINADFSKVRTNSTTGTFKINSDFSDTNISDHTGRLDANVEFASLRCDKLDGSFDVSSEFGEVDLLLVYLAGSSSASTSFGSIDIRLPEDTGAVFHSNKSFASIKFNTGGSLTYEGHNGSRRVLRGGGPRMDLNADFGSISVRDNVRGKQRTSQRIDEGSGANPMTQGAWQRYKSDGETLTLRVTDTRKESRRRVTTLEFDENESSPFESIDVCETDKGLSLYGINGNFFGRDLSGVQFNPSRLWLPFEDDVETEDVLLGTVNAYALKSTVDTPAGEISSVFHYDIEFRNSPVHTIRYALGTGFVAFDDFKLVAYDSGNKADKSTESPPPKPRFEEGVVRSVKIRGARLLKSSEVKELLVIREGTSYTRDEISEDVRN
ncbi:MAG: hypothetical protein HOC71_04935, partial [Candidatus Latescibacteria bacterium]|nr:hypothetical protein [Candidatus Latescibacterota bacterium]